MAKPSCCPLLAGYLLALLLHPEDGGSTSLRNVGELLSDYMTTQLTSLYFLSETFTGFSPPGLVQ
jgi:hypothetical protein